MVAVNLYLGLKVLASLIIFGSMICLQYTKPIYGLWYIRWYICENVQWRQKKARVQGYASNAPYLRQRQPEGGAGCGGCRHPQFMPPLPSHPQLRRIRNHAN
ncbi:hypothetical protein GGX14DRAFT_405865 [Mycena pura]|uniref:Uncharacterized protein n=1 Tax=Mycena pura TaxID=153505 RepID=A0AAD6URA7_9AGAR|nr:hypothetical protein GGX14DRAFT_405865 [Mycena pura]